jgi:molybdenum-dependent DNA-binding transcriptional regulator ModE
VGGSSGGGSQLTPQAEDLVKRYRALIADVDATMEQGFQRHFGDWVDPEVPAADSSTLPE